MKDLGTTRTRAHPPYYVAVRSRRDQTGTWHISGVLVPCRERFGCAQRSVAHTDSVRHLARRHGTDSKPCESRHENNPPRNMDHQPRPVRANDRWQIAKVVRIRTSSARKNQSQQEPDTKRTRPSRSPFVHQSRDSRRRFISSNIRQIRPKTQRVPVLRGHLRHPGRQERARRMSRQHMCMR